MNDGGRAPGSFPVDFAMLVPRPTPNQHLILPPGFKAAATPHAVSPVFEMEVHRLEAAWQSMIAHRPRVRLLQSDPTIRQAAYVSRSRWLRFPDDVTVQFLPWAGGATLAVYSRSRYGLADFGVNRRRIESWLEELRHQDAP